MTHKTIPFIVLILLLQTSIFLQFSNHFDGSLTYTRSNKTGISYNKDFSNSSLFDQNTLVSKDNETVPAVWKTHFYPSIAMNPENNELYVLWTNYTGLGLSILNNTCESVTSITPIKDVKWYAWPVIAAGKNNTIHVVVPDQLQMRYVQSDDGGKSFNKSIQLMTDGRAECPSIVLDSSRNKVYIAFWCLSIGANSTGGINLFRSDNGGKSFIDLGRITNYSSKASEDSCAIDIDENGNLIIVHGYVYKTYLNGSWIDYDELYCIKSTDYGKTFSNPVKITDTPINKYFRRYNPSMKAGPNGEIYVAWTDNRDGYDRIYFSRSFDYGKSFTQNIPLSKSSGTEDTPSLTIDNSGTIHIVWNRIDAGQYSGNIIYVNSTNEGTSFNREIKVNDMDNSTYSNARPTSVVDKNTGRVYVSWVDMRDYSEYYNTEIYMSKGNTYFPTIEKIPRRYVIANEKWQEQIYLKRKTNISSYGVISGPSGISLSSTGLFSWTPKDIQVGNHTVMFYANDVWGHNTSSSFYITVLPVPRVILISPNGGENWIAGSEHNITWRATTGNDTLDYKLKVKLEYSSTGINGTYLVIVNNLSNTDRYSWTVPNTESKEIYVKITVTDLYGQNASDLSDKPFAIYRQVELPDNMNIYYSCGWSGIVIFLIIGMYAIARGISEERKKKFTEPLLYDHPKFL